MLASHLYNFRPNSFITGLGVARDRATYVCRWCGAEFPTLRDYLNHLDVCVYYKVWLRDHGVPIRINRVELRRAKEAKARRPASRTLRTLATPT